MNKFVLASVLFFTFLINSQLDAQHLKLENQIVSAELAYEKIEKNELLLIIGGGRRKPMTTTCDSLVSKELGFKLVNLMGCIWEEGKVKQMKEYNTVMEAELKKNGIDDWRNTYHNLVVECGSNK